MTAPSPGQGPTRRAPRRRSGAAAALGWGALFFVAAQLGLFLVGELCWPALRDPEFYLRLARLRRQRAENPGRPLVLALGNSRTAMGFRPEALPRGPATGGAGPLAFNFAQLGSGPVMQLLCLHRLLDEGVRPDGVLVECWPPLWDQEGDLAELARYPVTRMTWRDLPRVRRYAAPGRPLYAEWWRDRLVPWFSNRFVLLQHLAPAWVPGGLRADHGWKPMDATGWLDGPCAGAGRRHGEQIERARWGPRLEALRTSAASDRALRELLALCRDEGISVALVYMPEGSRFRELYPPAVRAAVDGYLDGLCRDFGVPLIDARLWVPDDEFTDGFHLTPGGATVFTRRFGEEALRPLLAGRPGPREVVRGGRD